MHKKVILIYYQARSILCFNLISNTKDKHHNFENMYEIFFLNGFKFVELFKTILKHTYFRLSLSS